MGLFWGLISGYLNLKGKIESTAPLKYVFHFSIEKKNENVHHFWTVFRVLGR